MASSTSITLFNESIGRISVDGTMVRGEGGYINPQLVIPLKISLHNQPDDAMLAIGRIRALLGADYYVNPAKAICPPASEDLIGPNACFRLYSQPTGQSPDLVNLRFFLTPAQVEELERCRHASPSEVFTLYLQLEPTVIGLKNFNIQTPGTTPEPRIWDAKYGMYAEPAVFWSAREPEPLRIDVEASAWVRNVLPGLGYDQLRLVEVTLPPPLPDQQGQSATTEFDKAKTALDTRRYEDCVAACRGLLAMWEQGAGATDGKRLAEVVAERLGWAEGDTRQQFLDSAWKAARDFVNASHHPEGSGQGVRLDYRDARLTLMLTALLSEYLGSLPPS
ncbi:MAG: hypothetical protein ACYDEY_13350 [Acidimicrobiales bacterium]